MPGAGFRGAAEANIGLTAQHRYAERAIFLETDIECRIFGRDHAVAGLDAKRLFILGHRKPDAPFGEPQMARRLRK